MVVRILVGIGVFLTLCFFAAMIIVPIRQHKQAQKELEEMKKNQK